MNGPDDIRRALGRLALVLAVLGFGSVALGVGLAALGLLGGAAMLFGSVSAGGAVGVSALCVVGGAVIAAGGVPELLAWYGISQRAAWGRWLGIVLCTTMLAAFPLGTAFGAWGLWVLLSSAGVRAFGQERSWLGDGAALAAGWFLMPGDDDRCYRVDRRGRRHRRGRHGGRGGLVVLLLLFGFFAFASCGSCWRSFARGVSSGAAPSAGTGTIADSSGMSFGDPATLGAQAGTWLRERGALDAVSAGVRPAPVGVPLPRDSGDGASASTGMEPKPVERPASPTPPQSPPDIDKRGTGQLWIFEDARGETHIVDDVAKIPEGQRAKARPFK